MLKIVVVIAMCSFVSSCDVREGVQDIVIPKVIALNGADTMLLKKLDSMYTSAVSLDTTDRVFLTSDEEKTLGKRWVDFHQGVAMFLSSNGLHLVKQNACFTTLYCSKNGSIDHFAYAFSEPIDKAKEVQFVELLEQHIASHGLGMTAPQQYSQCGGVDYGLEKRRRIVSP